MTTLNKKIDSFTRSKAGIQESLCRSSSACCIWIESMALAPPHPHSPSRDGRPSGRPMWGRREGVGGRADRGDFECAIAGSLRRTARSPSSVLPRKGGGRALARSARKLNSRRPWLPLARERQTEGSTQACIRAPLVILFTIFLSSRRATPTTFIASGA